ncbi:hypothetical protein EV207_10464 [Scopulibacillus darangshiensis]|uniref:Probable membrane transporter protein n=1 Tax=Scopulibacillus darangshiensis TaxID=442528 RepID=A0A4R2PAG2_9BACL|nr:sulfite exporter TauE/SafE family protein [Scopulibacillus darangshiensis]TCP30885.1 hypothetical protein EV207_10464 [Scopulibacillus darangshiensis]
MLSGILLFIIALLSGAYGVIVGAGGGFIFVPVLLIFFHMSPVTAAGTGLVVVMLNALSGITGYVKQRRIDYKIGIILALGALPGTLIGTWLGRSSSSQLFYLIFSSVIVLLGLFLLIKKAPSNKNVEDKQRDETAVALHKQNSTEETISHKPSQNYYSLLAIGLLLGVVSSYLGIGGGWLLVPILIYIYRVAPHYATATSIFSLCLYSAIGVITQIYYGHIDWSVVLWGGLGVLVGGQAGAYMSNKLSGRLIIKMLSILLIGVGVKLFFS